jgi:hypothetical protein
VLLAVHVKVADDPGRTLPAAGLVTASETLFEDWPLFPDEFPPLL